MRTMDCEYAIVDGRYYDVSPPGRLMDSIEAGYGQWTFRPIEYSIEFQVQVQVQVR